MHKSPFRSFRARTLVGYVLAAGLGTACFVGCGSDDSASPSGGDDSGADGASDAGSTGTEDSATPDATTDSGGSAAPDAGDASRGDAGESDGSTVNGNDGASGDGATPDGSTVTPDGSADGGGTDGAASDGASGDGAASDGAALDASGDGGDGGPVCGNDVVETGEQCDLGTANNTGAYGGCNANCTVAAFCGDGTVNGTEACDLGTANNTGAYGGCNANCTVAAFCGDGVVNGTEACDLGTANNTGAYGGCNANCTAAAFCGDGVVNGTETCDLGTANNSDVFSTCSSTCTATSLLLLLDGSDPNGTGVLPADGASLPAWVDKATGVSVVTAASASAPTFVLSGINGKPSVQFQNDAILDADLDINASVTPNVTVIAVIQNFAGITTPYSGVWGLDHGGWGRFAASGGTLGGNGVSNGGGFTPVTGLTATATPLVFTTILNGSTSNGSFAYVNGTLGATFTGSTVAGGTHLSIGSLNAPDHFMSGYSMFGYMAEVLVYGSALSDADRTTVETALMAKY